MLKRFFQMGNRGSQARKEEIEDEYTRPQGLRAARNLDRRRLRRLILEGKLAPCFPGCEERGSGSGGGSRSREGADVEECPICFLHFPGLNRARCCSQGICTECFLKVKAPQQARTTQCPFCKGTPFAVHFRGPKSAEEREQEAEEEQRVIEALLRSRQGGSSGKEEGGVGGGAGAGAGGSLGARGGGAEPRRASTPPPPAAPAPQGMHSRSRSSVGPSTSAALASTSRAGGGGGPVAAARGGGGWHVFGALMGRRGGGGGPAAQRAVEADSLWFAAAPVRSSTGGGGAQTAADSSESDATGPPPVANAPLVLPGRLRPGGQLVLGGSPPSWASDNELGLDMEDIMMLEAVWQSLGPAAPAAPAAAPHAASTSAPSAPPPTDPRGRRRGDSPRVGSHQTLTGGLAGAIAALAERHLEARGEGRGRPEGAQGGPAAAAAVGEVEADVAGGVAPAGVDLDISSSAVPVVGPIAPTSVLQSGGLTRRTLRVLRPLPSDRDSAPAAPPPSEAPLEASVPGTFEEQMMLAIALSLADAEGGSAAT